MRLNVLVIGGTRFFGRRIVLKLLERGHEVTVFTRGTSRPDFWNRVKTMAGDRSNHAEFEDKLAGRTFDIVFDNIAYTRKDVESAVRALSGRTGHYLLCSTGSVYRDYPDSRQLEARREEDADLDFKGDLDYAEGKREAEKVLLEQADRTTLPFTMIRPPVVQGPYDPSGRAWYWIQRVADGNDVLVPETEPSTVFSLAFSDDIAEGFLRAMGNEAAFGRSYNIAGAEVFSLEDYVRTIARVVGQKTRVVSVPLAAIRREARLEAFEATLAEMRFVMDISAARRDLGFVPTPVDTWMETTARWFMNDYKGADSIGYDKRPAEVALAKRWAAWM
jgi:nucleoside-diphosphate-sugar epimerase